MRDSEDIPEDLPDEVPIADAVEQQLPAVDPTPVDEEAPEEDENELPLEASQADWQEQREVVIVDPEPEEFDRG